MGIRDRDEHVGLPDRPAMFMKRFRPSSSPKHSSFSRATLRRFLHVLLMTTLLAWTGNTEGRKDTTILVPGGRIDLFVTYNQKADFTNQDLIAWVSAASKSVSTYFGRYPVPEVAIRVTTISGKGVHHGRTFGSPAPLILISVGRDTTVKDLEADWTMTHEMVHLAFPSVPETNHWIEEGTATYVEPIARVQAGILQPAKMWNDVVRDLPQGLPAPGDRGLDVTHTWGRTYWGGALFCLLADVEIHERTHNQKGLQDALRGILAAGGNVTEDWPLERALRTGDAATGTTVLEDLYQQMKNKPVTVDLASMWRNLGIQRSKNGDTSFNDDAPLASIRDSITAVRNSQGSVNSLSVDQTFAARNRE